MFYILDITKQLSSIAYLILIVLEISCFNTTIDDSVIH